MFQRTRDDKNAIRDHAIMSSRPLRYINDAFLETRALKQTHPEDIDVNSELREKPTRLNEFNRINTQLYGTSAYIASGLQDPATEINVESGLIFGDSTIGVSRKRLTELPHYRPEFLDIPLETDSELRAKSTRTDMRNTYGKLNCYRQRS